MTLQQLKYVSMVERCGSFSKAAQKLYVSQPSVSNLVHGLEEELHITIFQRTPSGVVITTEGRELLKLLEPGSYVPAAKLELELPAGEYACTAYIYAYRLADESYVGKVSAGLELTVQA